MGGSLNQDNRRDDSARQDSRPKTNQRDNTLNEYIINQNDVSAESGWGQCVAFRFTNLMIDTESSVKIDNYRVLSNRSKSLSQRQGARPKTKSNILDIRNITQNVVNTESLVWVEINLMFNTERSVKIDKYRVLGIRSKSLSQRQGARPKTKSNILNIRNTTQNVVITESLGCGEIMYFEKGLKKKYKYDLSKIGVQELAIMTLEGLFENSEEMKTHLAMVKDGTEINRYTNKYITYRKDTDLRKTLEIFAEHGTSYSQRDNNQGLVLVFGEDMMSLQKVLLSENIDNKMKTALENVPSEIFTFVKRLSARSPTPSKITMDMLRVAAKQNGLEAMFTGIERSNQSLRYVLLFPDDCRLFLWIPTTDDSFISRKEKLYLVSFPRRVNGSNSTHNKSLHR